MLVSLVSRLNSACMCSSSWSVNINHVSLIISGSSTQDFPHTGTWSIAAYKGSIKPSPQRFESSCIGDHCDHRQHACYSGSKQSAHTGRTFSRCRQAHAAQSKLPTFHQSQRSVRISAGLAWVTLHAISLCITCIYHTQVLAFCCSLQMQ